MNPESLSFVVVAIVAYAIGALLSFISVGRAKTTVSWPQLTLAIVAVLAQTVGLGVHCATSSTHYFTSPMEILWLLSWSVGVNYVLILAAWRIVGLGVLVLPLNVALLAASLFSQYPGPAPFGELDLHPCYPPHVILAFLGYGFFLSACGISILYLRAERLLKHKLFGAVFHGIPSLERLERTAGRCIWAGFCFFTIALVLGGYLAHAHGVASWFLKPKMLAAEITWLVFLVLIIGRAAGRLIGRLAAQTVLVGAALVALTIVLGHPLKITNGNDTPAPQEQQKP
jgi:ABC-type uncharacterized transport system permease subunit